MLAVISVFDFWRPCGAGTDLQQSVEGSLVVLQHPQGHGPEEGVRVGLVRVVVLAALVHAQDVLIQQLAHRLGQGVVNLVQATDDQSQLEVVQLVQQHLGDGQSQSKL